MKKILLSEGRFALVDDADYEWLSQWKWYADRSRHTFYARRNSPPNLPGKRMRILMHRLILGLKPGDCKQTDHIDGNGLNNVRSNLRICTRQQNGFNRPSNQGTSSRFKGVIWHKGHRKWMATIGHNGKSKYLGYFSNEVKAARAYNKAAGELFGEFARLNFNDKNPFGPVPAIIKDCIIKAEEKNEIRKEIKSNGI